MKAFVKEHIGELIGEAAAVFTVLFSLARGDWLVAFWAGIACLWVGVALGWHRRAITPLELEVSFGITPIEDADAR